MQCHPLLPIHNSVVYKMLNQKCKIDNNKKYCRIRIFSLPKLARFFAPMHMYDIMYLYTMLFFVKENYCELNLKMYEGFLLDLVFILFYTIAPCLLQLHSIFLPFLKIQPPISSIDLSTYCLLNSDAFTDSPERFLGQRKTS